jgi:tetratricopeptide (TPR) repeat protein
LTTPPGMRVFFSYAHEDRAIAVALSFGLQSRGCEIWIDQGQLGGGDSLVEKIAGGISDANIVVALVSRYSAASRWCRKELLLALSREVVEDLIVIPVLVDKTEMPPELGGKVYLQVKRSRPDELVPKLYEDIQRHVGNGKAGSRDAVSEADGAYERGRNLYAKGELAAARRELHNASQESHHAAALLLGKILFDQGDLQRAESELQFAAGSPDEETATAAVIAYAQLIVDPAFETEARGGSSSRAALIGRGIQEAEKLWLAAAESGDRDAAWAWVGLGRLFEGLAERGVDPDPERAEEAFEQAARSGHPGCHAYALLKLGRVQRQLGKFEEAVEIFKIGARSGDKDLAPRCAFEAGLLCWKLWQDAEALMLWHEAAESGHPLIADSAREAYEDPGSNFRSR